MKKYQCPCCGYFTYNVPANEDCGYICPVCFWENDHNMPDLDILIEISDFYEVDLREILNGERKSGNMDKEVKETVLQTADYTNTEAERYNKRVRICNGITFLLVLAYTIIKDTSLYNNPTVVTGLSLKNTKKK